MLLGRKPIAIATMASITTTRMAAASISISFSVAQSPDGVRLVPSMGLAATPPASKAVWLAAPNLRPAALIRPRWRYARCGSRMVPGVPGDAIWGGAASATQLEVRFHRGRSEQPLAADASPRPVRVPVAPSGLLPTPIPATPVRRIGVQGL